MQNTPPPELPIESAAALLKPEMPRSARIAAGGTVSLGYAGRVFTQKA